MRKLFLKSIFPFIGISVALGIIYVFFNKPQTIIKTPHNKNTNSEQSDPAINNPNTKPNNKLKKYQRVTSMLRSPPKKEKRDIQMDFAIGRSFFVNPWVIPPSSTNARDGLGPLYNARTCETCHQGGGRGHAPNEGDAMRKMLIRLSIPGKDEKRGVIPEPTYGSQIQLFGIQRGGNGYKSETSTTQNKAIGEAEISVKYKLITGNYPDGNTYTLTEPHFKIKNLSYGALSENVLISPRIGPSLSGVGLINEIAEKDILNLADPNDNNNDGISGRPNYVWSKEHNKTMLGRFGLKANTPTLRQQVADAFVNDIGITSYIFPNENCGSKQTACIKAEHGRGPNTPHEISDELLDNVTTFVSHLNTPQKQYTKNNQKDGITRGRREFFSLGCSSCHQPTYTIPEDAKFKTYQAKIITPYSDFLLHDMGEKLADHRPDYEATGSEWRTAPLWGIGWRQSQGRFNNYLHDGRAKTIEEAILWHGGEAETTKQKFMQLPKKRRESLFEFIKSL